MCCWSMLSFWRLFCCWWSASLINPDAALLYCRQVTHHCSPSTCGSECWAIEWKSIKWKVFTAMWQVQTFERGDQFGRTPNQQTVLSPGISAVLFCFSLFFTSLMCDLVVGPLQCLPVSHTHWAEKHSLRPRWISWANCIFSCSCRYWYHTTVLKRLHCCSGFTFKLALKGYSCYSEVQHLLEHCLKAFWGFGDLRDITVHKYKI